MFAHRGIRLCTFCARFIQNRNGGRGLKMSIGHYNLRRETDMTSLPWWTPSRPFTHSRFRDLYENESVQRYVRQVMEEYGEVNHRIQHACLGEAERRDLNRRQVELSSVAEMLQSVHRAETDLQDVLSLLDGTAGAGEEDKQLTQLLKEEHAQISQRIAALKGDVLKTLVPSDPLDSCDVFLEVVSGRTTGGDICQQFTREMFDMYQGFAGYKNWDFEVFNYTNAEYGGLHHASVRIGGEGAYGRLKHEGGTHRVQRIPEVGLSSRMQRIHTGTMTVIVLPQSSEVDISIDPKDLRIDTFRSRGAGGQNVNTTDSAVRIVHLPTGTSAECQQSRSQLKNRDTAMQMLKARLYQSMMGKEVEERHMARKEQVGTRSQSERIRTYNFSQDRVTDHRTGYVTRDIKEFMEGGEALDDLIEDVLEHGEREALLDLVESSLKAGRTTE